MGMNAAGLRMSRDIDWLRVARWVGVAGLAVVWVLLLVLQPDVTGKPFGVDAMAYHGSPMANPYDGPQVGLPGAYLYPPPFIQLLTPLRLLPWELFIALWLALELAALAWLLSPAIALLALAIPYVLAEVAIGNVHLFMAVAMVIGIRRPAAWAFVALTKPTVAVVATWHIFRREWSAAGIASLTTAAIVIGSVLLAPGLWVAWIDRMRGDTGTAGSAWMVALGIRIVLAGVITWLAARRSRPIFLPLAAFIALPIPWLEGLTLFAAMPRLARSR